MCDRSRFTYNFRTLLDRTLASHVMRLAERDRLSESATIRTIILDHYERSKGTPKGPVPEARHDG